MEPDPERLRKASNSRSSGQETKIQAIRNRRIKTKRGECCRSFKKSDIPFSLRVKSENRQKGGGARGAFQIGVWRALKEAGIRIRGISGVSVGALNGELMRAIQKALGIFLCANFFDKTAWNRVY